MAQLKPVFVVAMEYLGADVEGRRGTPRQPVREHAYDVRAGALAAHGGHPPRVGFPGPAARLGQHPLRAALPRVHSPRQRGCAAARRTCARSIPVLTPVRPGLRIHAERVEDARGEDAGVERDGAGRSENFAVTTTTTRSGSVLPAMTCRLARLTRQRLAPGEPTRWGLSLARAEPCDVGDRDVDDETSHLCRRVGDPRARSSRTIGSARASSLQSLPAPWSSLWPEC